MSAHDLPCWPEVYDRAPKLNGRRDRAVATALVAKWLAAEDDYGIDFHTVAVSGVHITGTGTVALADHLGASEFNYPAASRSWYVPVVAGVVVPVFIHDTAGCEPGGGDVA